MLTMWPERAHTQKDSNVTAIKDVSEKKCSGHVNDKLL